MVSQQIPIYVKFYSIGIMLCLLAACSGKGAIKNATQSVETVASIDRDIVDQPEFVVPKPERKTYVHNAAVKRLIQRSNGFVEIKQYTSAISELERGLAIAPNNPHLWQNLALVRLKQGRYFQAEQLASKSNALSQDDVLLKNKNEEIIAEARKHQ